MSKRSAKGSIKTPKTCRSVSEGSVRCRLASGHPNIHIGNGPGGTSVWWLNEKNVPSKEGFMAAKKKTAAPAAKPKTKRFVVSFTVHVLDNKAANPSDVDDAITEVIDSEIMTTKGLKTKATEVRFIDASGFNVREVW